MCVLLGKTGNGKSTIGNHIIGRENIGERLFKQSGAASSVTKVCQYGTREKKDRVIEVIDTPGFIDTSIVSLSSELLYVQGMKETTETTLMEIARIFKMAPDGFDAYLVVQRFGNRLTLEDFQALETLKAFLGEDAKSRMVLILTYGDQCSIQANDDGLTADEYLENWMKSLPDWNKRFIEEIGGRVVLFDNITEDANAKLTQLKNLVEVIDNMVGERKRYTNKLTVASKQHLDAQIKKALDAIGLTKELEKAQKEVKKLEEKIKKTQELNRKEKERIQKKLEAKQLELGEVQAKKREVEEETRKDHQSGKGIREFYWAIFETFMDFFRSFVSKN